MASQSQKDKEKFFADLDALDRLAGEDDDLSSPVEDDSRKAQDNGQQSSQSSDRRSPTLAGRTGLRSDTGATQEQPKDSVAQVAGIRRNRTDERSRKITAIPPRVISSMTAPEVTSTSPTQLSVITPTLRRRHTDDAVAKPNKRTKKKGPDVPQIFADQTFFYVPNNDRALPRKRRIDKAILHGATWTREWAPSSVTHVIVEGDKTMEDVVRVTGQEQLPADIALVRDTWLTESLSYKEMRDFKARRFQIIDHRPIERPTAAIESKRTSFEEQARASSPSEESTVADVQSVDE